MTSKEFTDIYVPLGESLYRVAFNILETSQDASDAVQDLYVKLWDSLDTLDNVHNPKAYCITLLRNICIDRIRRQSRMKSTALADQPASEPDPLGKVEEREELNRIARAMEKLPESQRKILEMRVLQDMSYDRIAAETGISSLSLRVLLSRARKSLKNAI